MEKNKNYILYINASNAIKELYIDLSVSREQTMDNLELLRDEIITIIDLLNIYET